MMLRGVDLSELAVAIAEVIEEYMEEHPDFTADEAAAALSFVHGAIFRVASDIPPSKLH